MPTMNTETHVSTVLVTKTFGEHGSVSSTTAVLAGAGAYTTQAQSECLFTGICM